MIQQNQVIVGKQSKYQIRRIIESQQKGQVYSGIDLNNQIEVSIKITTHYNENEQNALNQLLLKGPFKHLINVLDMNVPIQNQNFYMVVMDLADGCFYDFWQQNSLRINERKVLIYFYQITCGIYEMHRINLIHRDIKLENIVYLYSLLNEEFFLKVSNTQLMRDNVDNSRKSMGVGSTLYMAPEMLNQNNYTEKVDIWSLGIILLEMISNNSLFSKNISYQEQVKQLETIKQEQINQRINLIQCSNFIKQILKQILVIIPQDRLSARDILLKLEKQLFLSISFVKEDEIYALIEEFEVEKKKQITNELENELKKKEQKINQDIQTFEIQSKEKYQQQLEEEIRNLIEIEEKQKQLEIQQLEQKYEQKTQQLIQKQNQLEILKQNIIETQKVKEQEIRNIEIRQSEQIDFQKAQLIQKAEQQLQIDIQQFKQEQQKQVQEQIQQRYYLKFQEQMKLKQEIINFKMINKQEFLACKYLIESQKEVYEQKKTRDINQEQQQILESFLTILEQQNKKILQILSEIDMIQDIEGKLKFQTRKESDLKFISSEMIQQLILEQQTILQSCDDKAQNQRDKNSQFEQCAKLREQVIKLQSELNFQLIQVQQYVDTQQLNGINFKNQQLLEKIYQLEQSIQSQNEATFSQIFVRQIQQLMIDSEIYIRQFNEIVQQQTFIINSQKISVRDQILSQMQSILDIQNLPEQIFSIIYKFKNLSKLTNIEKMSLSQLNQQNSYFIILSSELIGFVDLYIMANIEIKIENFLLQLSECLNIIFQEDNEIGSNNQQLKFQNSIIQLQKSGQDIFIEIIDLISNELQNDSFFDLDYLEIDLENQSVKQSKNPVNIQILCEEMNKIIQNFQSQHDNLNEQQQNSENFFQSLNKNLIKYPNINQEYKVQIQKVKESLLERKQNLTDDLIVLQKFMLDQNYIEDLDQKLQSFYQKVKQFQQLKTQIQILKNKINDQQLYNSQFTIQEIKFVINENQQIKQNENYVLSLQKELKKGFEHFYKFFLIYELLINKNYFTRLLKFYIKTKSLNQDQEQLSIIIKNLIKQFDNIQLQVSDNNFFAFDYKEIEENLQKFQHYQPLQKIGCSLEKDLINFQQFFDFLFKTQNLIKVKIDNLNNVKLRNKLKNLKIYQLTYDKQLELLSLISSTKYFQLI